jgi:hypothetical protein
LQARSGEHDSQRSAEDRGDKRGACAENNGIEQQSTAPDIERRCTDYVSGSTQELGKQIAHWQEAAHDKCTDRRADHDSST